MNGGVAESKAGNQSTAVWLITLSLADQGAASFPDNKRGKLSLAGIGINFLHLYEQYHDRVFIEAHGAAAQLGLTLDLDQTTRSYFNKYLEKSRSEGVGNMDLDKAMECFHSAAKTAWRKGGGKKSLPHSLPSPPEMTFLGLRQLIENTAQRRKR